MPKRLSSAKYLVSTGYDGCCPDPPIKIMCAITPPEGSSPTEATAWIRSRIKDELAKSSDELCIDGKTPDECIALLRIALRAARAKTIIPSPGATRYTI